MTIDQNHKVKLWGKTAKKTERKKERKKKKEKKKDSKKVKGEPARPEGWWGSGPLTAPGILNITLRILHTDVHNQCSRELM